MAKGDMPNASVGIGYQPQGQMGGMVSGSTQTPGRIGTAMPPNAMGTMGGSSFAPMGNTGMFPGQGVGPSPQILQMILGRMFGQGAQPMGQAMPQMGGGFMGHLGQGLQNLGRMQGSVMGQPGNNQVGPRFTGGSTYNRPQNSGQ